MSMEKIKLKCRHCKNITGHSIPSKNFESAKEKIQNRGCMRCKQKKLEDITNGHVETIFGCASCGTRRIHDLSLDTDDLNNSIYDISAEGCPNCSSMVDWVHLSGNPVRK